MAHQLLEPTTTTESAHVLVEGDDQRTLTPEAAMELVHRVHSRPLYRFLLRVTLGDAREAEDLLQETLLKAWRYLQDHPGDAENLRPWLYTLARRIAIDGARARQARPTEVGTTDLSTYPASHDDIERALVGVTMRRGLMSLAPSHREVLIEIFYHDRSARQAAEKLGIP